MVSKCLIEVERGVGAPVSMNLVHEPYNKKRRKRPMTSAQLAEMYARQPRVDYDSDDEPMRNGTPEHERHARAIAAEAMSLPTDALEPVVQFHCEQNPPTHPDEEWMRELEAVLSVRRDEAHRQWSSDSVRVGTRETEKNGLCGALYDPERVVADPFFPDLTCTAAERDACLEDEQERRCEEGLPLLVRDSVNPEHWVEPPVTGVASDGRPFVLYPAVSLAPSTV